MSQTIEMIDLVTGEILDQQQIAEQLLAQAKEKGVSLVGPGGLLGGLTKTVLETALEAEMTDSQRSLETALDPTDEKTTRQSRR